MGKAIFTINNHTYRAKAITPSLESLASENSGRDDAGYMHIEWIREKIRKFEIQMPPMLASEAQQLINDVQGQEYTINIFDISTNTTTNIDAYTGSTKAQCYSGVIKNGIWTGFTFTATEV